MTPSICKMRPSPRDNSVNAGGREATTKMTASTTTKPRTAKDQTSSRFANDLFRGVLGAIDVVVSFTVAGRKSVACGPWSVGLRVGNSGSCCRAAVCRLTVGDTADWQSALRSQRERECGRARQGLAVPVGASALARRAARGLPGHTVFPPGSGWGQLRSGRASVGAVPGSALALAS